MLVIFAPYRCFIHAIFPIMVLINAFYHIFYSIQDVLGVSVATTLRLCMMGKQLKVKKCNKNILFQCVKHGRPRSVPMRLSLAIELVATRRTRDLVLHNDPEMPPCWHLRASAADQWAAGWSWEGWFSQLHTSVILCDIPGVQRRRRLAYLATPLQCVKPDPLTLTLKQSELKLPTSCGSDCYTVYSHACTHTHWHMYTLTRTHRHTHTDTHTQTVRGVI